MYPGAEGLLKRMEAAEACQYLSKRQWVHWLEQYCCCADEAAIICILTALCLLEIIKSQKGSLCSQRRLPHYSVCTLPHVGADALRALRTLLAREQRRMRGEYEIRLKELERERLHAEQDKAQVSGSCRHLCGQLSALLEIQSDPSCAGGDQTGSQLTQLVRQHAVSEVEFTISAADAGAACAAWP